MLARSVGWDWSSCFTNSGGRRALGRAKWEGAGRALRDQLGAARASLLEAVESVLHPRHRASSAIEGFNAALRPHLYVHKGATQGFLALFRAWGGSTDHNMGTAGFRERNPNRGESPMRIVAIALTVVATLGAARVASAAEMAGTDIIGADGAVIGKATFEQTPTGVLMSVEVAGLPPGGHGIHLHATGSCTPNFKAATGHINPGKVKHGLRNPEGPDNGDLPNLFAATDGSAKAEFFTTRVSVAGGDLPALLDEDGSAVIIHENPDDHMAQPIGGAGGRIGCGIIANM